VQAALRDRKISTGHARALINVETEEDQKAIFDKILKNGYSVRQTEKAVRALDAESSSRKKSTSSKISKQQKRFFKDISNRLRHQFSTKVQIKPKKKGGEIQIEFYSDDELQRLLDIFESIS